MHCPQARCVLPEKSQLCQTGFSIVLPCWLHRSSLCFLQDYSHSLRLLVLRYCSLLYAPHPPHTHCPHMCNQSTVKVFLQFPDLSFITVDSDCSREINRCLLCGRKAMTNLDSVLKNRDTTLPTKVCIVKAMVFPVVMYGCETWTIKKAKH